jgi:hypothetical protein
MRNKNEIFVKSFECLVDQGGEKVPGTQHSWLIKRTGLMDNSFVIDGIIDSTVYQ